MILILIVGGYIKKTFALTLIIIFSAIPSFSGVKKKIHKKTNQEIKKSIEAKTDTNLNWNEQ